MAKEIQIVTDTSGQTLYAQVFRATDGKVWNTAGTPAFENYSTANIADYDVAMTEQGTASKIYMGTFPSAIGAGSYLVRILIRAGGSPAETDTLAGIGTIHWDGSAVIDVAAVHTNLESAMGATFDTSTDSLEAIRNRGDAEWITATGFATASDMATALAYIDTEVAAILADTNELQADWVDGGRLDLILDARASQASVDALNDPSAADIADAVWEEAIADHSGTAGSTAEALAAASAGASSPADIADAVWDEATAGHNAAGTFGEQVKNSIDYILEDTNELQTDWVNGGRLDLILDNLPAGTADAVWEEAIADHSGTAGSTAEALDGAGGGGGATASEIADAVWDEATAGHTTSGTFGEQLKTDVDAILADTNELQVDWVNGGRLDNILDARASQTSVDDLPTNAELAASQAAADDATLAAIAALNNISAAQVNAEVDTALADIRLNQLLAADSDIDGAAPPTVGSVFHELLSKTAGSFTFDQTTDSLEALRDRGDAAWITATGFSTHSAADVWAVATRTLTAGTNIQLPSNGLANVTAWTVAITGNITGNLSGNVTGNVGGNVSGNVVGSVGSLATQAQTDIRTATGLSAANLDTQLGAIDDFLDTEVAAIKAKTDNLPSDPADQSAVEAAITAATSSLATQASVNTIDDFLDTEVAAIKAKTDSLTFSTAGKVDAKLTSDGLDNLAVTAPSGVAATFREMVVQTWRRFFKKTVKSSSDIKTYADNGSTVLTTQTYTSASGTDTINEAT